jgi:hypothetical protein
MTLLTLKEWDSMSTNELFIQNLGRGLLFRELSSTETTYWAQQIEGGFTTPVLLTLQATKDKVFVNENLPLATMYYTLMGGFPTIKEMIFWRNVLDHGATLNDIGTALVTSKAFYTQYPSAALSNSAELNAIILATGVTSITSDLKSYALSHLSDGTLDWGTVVNYLVGLSNKQTTVGLGLIWTSIRGDTPKVSDISALGTNIDTAISNFYTQYGTSSSSPTAGHDILIGTSSVDKLRGLAGDDTITGGDGIDVFTFEANATENGIDTITDFTIGSTGDSLNFALYLNKVNDLNLATVLSTSTNQKSWVNGDVLVVSGNGLETPESIAALFGDHKSFATPTTASKVVLISADIVGDASIWYVTNQTQIDTISASEVQLVGVLNDVNNLALVGFNVANIA